MVDLTDDRAALPASAASEDDVAAADIDGSECTGVVRVSIGIDQKLAGREEDHAAAVCLGSSNGTDDGTLIGEIVIGRSPILSDIEHCMRSVGGRLAEMAVTRVGIVGQNRFRIGLHG